MEVCIKEKPVPESGVLLTETTTEGFIVTLEDVKDEFDCESFELCADGLLSSEDIKTEDIKTEDIKSVFLDPEDVAFENGDEYKDIEVVDNEIIVNDCLVDITTGETGAVPDDDGMITIEISEVVNGEIQTFQYRVRPCDFLESTLNEDTTAVKSKHHMTLNEANENSNQNRLNAKKTKRQPRKQSFKERLKDRVEASLDDADVVPFSRVKPTDKEKFVCSVCLKVFASKRTLSQHHVIHNPAREKYHCRICGNAVGDLKYLKIHEATCQCPWKCSICGKNFKFKTQLSVHTKEHKQSNMGLEHTKEHKQSSMRLEHTKEHKHGNMRLEHTKEHKQSIMRLEHTKEHKQSNMVLEHTKEHKQSSIRLEHTKEHKQSNMRLESSDLRADLPRADNQSSMQVDTEKEKRDLPANMKSSTGTCNIIKKIVKRAVKEYACPICSKIFKRRTTLKLHQNVHNPLREKQFQCNVCGERVSCASYLKNQQVVCNCSWRCDRCGKNFKLKTELNAHMKKQHQIDVHHETSLPSSSKSFIEQEEKLQSILPEPFISRSDANGVDITEKIVQKINDLTELNSNGEETLTIHTEIDVIKQTEPSLCSQDSIKDNLTHETDVTMESCAEEYKSEVKPLQIQDAQRNIESNYNSNSVRKEECKKIESNIKNGGFGEKRVKIKKNIVIKEKKTFVCPICSRVFKRNTTLKNHQRTHNPVRNKPFQCNICGRRISCQGYLRTHMATHSAAYKCDLCGRSFKYKSYMATHMRFHLNEKPYKCLECGKGFVGSNCLAKHRRIHTGISPYKCLVCHKMFAQKVCLDLHMVNHTGVKPYLCHICGQAFSLRSYLNTHVRDDHALGGRLTKKSSRVRFQAKKRFVSRPKPRAVRENSEESVVVQPRKSKRNVNADIKCEMCDRTFKNRLVMQSHLEEDHNNSYASTHGQYDNNGDSNNLSRGNESDSWDDNSLDEENSSQDDHDTGSHSSGSQDDHVPDDHKSSSQDDRLPDDHKSNSQDNHVPDDHKSNSQDNHVPDDHKSNSQDDNMNGDHKRNSQDSHVAGDHRKSIQGDNRTGDHKSSSQNDHVSDDHKSNNHDGYVNVDYKSNSQEDHKNSIETDDGTGYHKSSNQNDHVSDHKSNSQEDYVTGDHKNSIQTDDVAGNHKSSCQDDPVSGDHKNSSQQNHVTGDHESISHTDVLGDHKRSSQNGHVLVDHVIISQDDHVAGDPKISIQDDNEAGNHKSSSQDANVPDDHKSNSQDNHVTDDHKIISQTDVLGDHKRCNQNGHVLIDHKTVSQDDHEAGDHKSSNQNEEASGVRKNSSRLDHKRSRQHNRAFIDNKSDCESFQKRKHFVDKPKFKSVLNIEKSTVTEPRKSKRNVNTEYKCEICYRTFKNRLVLQVHFEEKHNSSYDSTFAQSDIVPSKHKPDSRDKCLLGDHKNGNEPLRAKQPRVRKPNSRLVSEEPVTISIIEPRKSKRNVNTEKPCKVCGKTLKNRLLLRDHLEEVHGMW